MPAANSHRAYSVVGALIISSHLLQYDTPPGAWHALWPALCDHLSACEETDAVLAILVKVAER